jgi:hypothetical protein
MSRQFTVTAIYQITKLVPVLNHDGNPYTNPDFPVGTILCQDRAGDWFCYVGPDKGESVSDPECWPRLPGKLYRDYWRCLPESDDAPYMKAVLAAEKKLIRGRAD